MNVSRLTTVGSLMIALCASACVLGGHIGDSKQDIQFGDGGGSSTGGGGDCTLTQGYWKTHEDAWPVDSLVIGGESYTEAELLDILWTPVAGDASLIIGHQLIAALLNVASGTSTDPSTDAALADAEAWMLANKDADGRLPYGTAKGSAAAQEAAAIGSALDSFNQGTVGPGHCGDGATSGSGSTSGGDTTSGSGAGGTTSTGGTGGSGCANMCIEPADCPNVGDTCISGCCGPVPN